MSLIDKSRAIPEKPIVKLYNLTIDKSISCPNFNPRAKTDKIQIICIHHSGSTNPGGDLNYLSTTHNPDGSRIYAGYHYYIDTDGKIYQLMDEDKRAWHAGASSLYGLVDAGGQSINGISLGICMTGNGKIPFSNKQYISLIELTHALKIKYDIEPTHIVGHLHVSPGRKIDPTPFHWDRLFRGIYHQ